MTKRNVSRALGLSPPLMATLGGQAIGALGIVIQFIAAPELFGRFPLGLVYIAGATAITWLDRRSTWSPSAAIALSIWIVFGGIAGGDLIDNVTSSNAALVAGNWVMVLGMLISAVSGVFAIRENRRTSVGALVKPLSARNPRRLAVIATIAGLLAAGFGDAIATRMQFDGPGPFLFVLIAVLVAAVPGRFVIWLAVVLSVVFVGGLLSNPESRQRLSNPADAVGFGFTVLQLLGLVVAVIGGIVATLPVRGASPARTRTDVEFITMHDDVSARSGGGRNRAPKTTQSHRIFIVATCVALMLAAIGDAATGYDGPGPFIYLGFAVVVATVRWRYTPLLAVLMALFFLFGGFANPDFAGRLVDPADTLEFLSGWLQILGFVATIVFAVAAVATARTRERASR